MEEVDSIILHFLKQLQINISEDYKNLSDLPVNIIIESVAKCLTTINPSLKIPSKLPQGISQRIEVATQIALTCKDLGFKNDVGYQTFLYFNEVELRQVFMFLIELLPNENKHRTSETVKVDNKSQLYIKICKNIEDQLNAVWIPPRCTSVKSLQTQVILDESQNLRTSDMNEVNLVKKLTSIKSKPHRKYMGSSGQLVSAQMCHLNLNEITECEVVNTFEGKSLQNLKEMAVVLRQKVDTYESEKNQMELEYIQVRKRFEKAEAELKNILDILQSIGIVNIDCDINDDIIDKLNKNINKLHSDNEELTSRNITLKAEIEKVQKSKALLESERNKYKKLLNNLKHTAKTMKEELAVKEKLKEQLIETYGRLRGGSRRSIYTKRILEIIGNVDKQNMDIKKILDDTRQLNKEINSLEGQLERCFSIADETFFKDAKKDDQAKKAYKLLALLHSECNSIVSLVNETGVLARDIVDLEDNIETEKAKRTEDTLKKILLDFKEMQEESKESK